MKPTNNLGSLPQARTAAAIALQVLGRLSPYIIVVLAIPLQDRLAIFIEKHLAFWWHIPQYGAWLAWVIFVVGGFLIGIGHLRGETDTEGLPRWRDDPITRACSLAVRHLHIFGFVLVASGLASMGASIGIKHEGWTRRPIWSFVAAVIYASIWIPGYNFLERFL